VSSRSSTQRALRRAVGVLELFELGREELSLSEISGMTAVPVASTFRVLQPLTELAAVITPVGRLVWSSGEANSAASGEAGPVTTMLRRAWVNLQCGRAEDPRGRMRRIHHN
jgi:hypothetical protein